MAENDLIEALKKGKRHAYEELLDRFQNKVFNKCLSFVPNKEDAEDIAQEVFVEIFRSIQNFKGQAKLSTWIYRIATNKCLEFIRKKNTKKRFAFLQLISGAQQPIDKVGYFTEFNHPGIQLEQKEQSEQLFKAINQLPENQKVVFTLHKVDGLSYKEVCEITQKSISSVESLMFRAKKNLQAQLATYYKKGN